MQHILVITRKKQALASASGMTLKIDGVEHKKLMCGESYSVNLNEGVHTIQTKVGLVREGLLSINVLPNTKRILCEVEVTATNDTNIILLANELDTSSTSSDFSRNKFCPSCGTDINQGVQFCPKCGTSISANIVNGASSNINSSYLTNPLYMNATKKKKGNSLLIALVCCAVIVFISVIILCFPSTETVEENGNSVEVEYLPTFEEVSETVGNWEVTILDFEYVDAVSAGLITEYQSEENGKICAISVKAKNIGDTADTFLPLFGFDTDSHVVITWNGYEFTRSELVLSGDLLSSETLNPLVEKTGKIYFQVPNDVIDSEISPVLEITDDGQTFACTLEKR